MASPNRPGVDVSQEIRQTSPSIQSPTLIPCSVALCYQIIDVLDADGALNGDAKYADEQYNQADMLIAQASYPDPRGNIDEINIDETEVGAYLYFGGQLKQLERGSNGSLGSAFMKAVNTSRRAGVICSVPTSMSFDAVTGDIFTFAVDVVNPVDTSQDVSVTLLGSMTVAEVAAAINSAVGSTVASVYNDADDDFGGGVLDYLMLLSPSYGATSSLTIRAGTSALSVMFGLSVADQAKEYRVEGAGFRGQDDEDGDLVTPWVEFFTGEYQEDSTEVVSWTALGTSSKVWPILYAQDDSFAAAEAAAVTFSGSSPTVPLRAATAAVPGDEFWADGVQVGSGEVIRVEASRFKLGRINASLSTVDSSTGEYTNRVYSTLEVATESNGNPFAPKYAYFRAAGLEFGDISPAGEAATLTGTLSGLDERAAIVMSASAIAADINLASLTLIFQVTEDGVVGDEVTYTFTGGPFAAVSDIVTAISGEDEFSQLTISAASDRLVLATTKTGAGQSISIKSTGTANTPLKFSTSSATEDTGKDHEFATRATVTGGTIALPMSDLSDLDFSLTVTDSKGEHSLAATGVDLSAATDLGDVLTELAKAFGGAAADLTLYDGPGGEGNGGIAVATISSSGDGDAHGTITITAIEGGASVTIELDATDGDGVDDDGFRYLGFYDAAGGAPARIDSDPTFANSLATSTIAFTFDDGTSTLITSPSTAGMDGAASAEALVALLNDDDDFTGVTDVGRRVVQWFTEDNDVISLRTLQGGATVSLDVAISQAGFDAMNFDVTSAISETGTDSPSSPPSDGTGADGLKSTKLVFQLDSNPHDYEITFASNSLQDAIDDTNELVNGSSDVASETASKMTLTSLLVGAASRVYIDETTSTADTVLGLTGSDDGSGRPNPDFYLDGDGSANIGANILRNQSSGEPFSLASAQADLYLTYKALRKDVTAMASDAAMLTFTNTSEIEASIGPISTENPLGLAAFLMKANAPSNSVSVLGVDEDAAAAPWGTLDGWVRALEFLQSREIYGLAPITEDEYVLGLVSTHIQSMSQPAERGERIGVFSAPIPSRGVAVTVSSGTDAESNGTDNSITLDVNPNSDLIANGIDPSDSIDYDERLYLEAVITTLGVSELRRYSVSDVSGVILTFRTSFASDENTDGFFSTTTFDETAEGVEWALKIRGDELNITGTSMPDKSARAAAAAAEALAYDHRRIFLLAADSVDVSIDGVTQNVPASYAAAAIVGMIAEQPPQRPFTLLPIAGLGQVYGTDDTFSENQLDTIADGGRCVLVNVGGAVVMRHQRSTDSTSAETREMSITKALDWFAKGLRSTNRVFIGKSNITRGFLDQLTTSNEGFLDYAENLGVVRKASLDSLLQDTEDKTKVLIDVTVQPVYPCNKIAITVVT